MRFTKLYPARDLYTILFHTPKASPVTIFSKISEHQLKKLQIIFTFAQKTQEI